MDSVHISDSSRVIDGLRDMMTAAIGPHDCIAHHVEVEIALLIIEVASRAKDRDDWFPRGRWATIQAIQSKTVERLNDLFPVQGAAIAADSGKERQA